MVTIDLMLAVNHYGNGMHTGRVDAVDLYTPDESVAPLLRLAGPPSRCYLSHSQNSHKPRILHIGRLRVRILSYATWVGNWCWDQARINIEDAPRIINYLQRRGWICEEGATHLFDKYVAGKDITIDDLEVVNE